MKKKDLRMLIESQAETIEIMRERMQNLFKRVTDLEQAFKEEELTIRRAKDGYLRDLTFTQDQLGFDLRTRSFKRLDRMEENINTLREDLMKLSCVAGKQKQRKE